MGLNKIGLVAVALLWPAICEAAWVGPAPVVVVEWGSESDQVGVSVGDTMAYDVLPTLVGAIDGRVFVRDEVNNAGLKIFDAQSGYLRATTLGIVPITRDRMVFWAGVPGESFRVGVTDVVTGAILWEQTEPPIPASCPSVGFRESVSSTHIWSCPYLYALDGTLIRETPERPLELGRVSARRQGGTYVYETEYVDRVFVWDQAPETLWVHPLRINDTTLMHAGRTARWTVTEEIPTLPGQKPRFRVAKTSPDFEMPMDTHECFDDLENITTGVTCHRRTSYGETPIIGPDGSVYTYKAVYPGNPEAGFHILKWTWQE